jgi:hypothetical protein
MSVSLLSDVHSSVSQRTTSIIEELDDIDCSPAINPMEYHAHGPLLIAIDAPTYDPLLTFISAKSLQPNTIQISNINVDTIPQTQTIPAKIVWEVNDGEETGVDVESIQESNEEQSDAEQNGRLLSLMTAANTQI